MALRRGPQLISAVALLSLGTAAPARAGGLSLDLVSPRGVGRAGAGMVSDDGFIFTGGYSNRDYDLLLSAAAEVPAPLVIVASSRNQISAAAGPNTTIHRDLPEGEFETLLARSRLVAMPLKSQGEACGQSVLLRVLRNGKPLVATRHEEVSAWRPSAGRPCSRSSRPSP